METSNYSSPLSVTLLASACALAVCLAVTSANGETINITLQATRTSTTSGSPAPVAPLTLSVLAEPTGQTLSSFQIAALEADSIERVLNYQIGDPPSYSATIREENAGDYGLNWEAFENGLNGFFKYARLSLGNIAISDTASENVIIDGTFTARGLEDFDMEEIRVKVDYYFWHPVLPGLQGMQFSLELDGSGREIIAPEPSSIAFCVMGLMCACLRRRRRRRQLLPLS